MASQRVPICGLRGMASAGSRTEESNKEHWFASAAGLGAGSYDGRMEIDYLLLAEHAEVTGSKLYLMGGGWDTMNVAEAPATVRVMLAAGVRVEWDETNVPVPLVVRVDDDDAQEIFRLEGQMNVGRPPHLPAGTSQLSQMTFALALKLPRFGGYRVSLTAGAAEREVRRSLPFRLAAPVTR